MPPSRAAMLVLTAALSARGGGDSDDGQPTNQRPRPGFRPGPEGYGDYRAHELTPLVDSKVGNARPDVVLLHLGTNDVLDDRSATGETKLGNKWADTVLAWRTY